MVYDGSILRVVGIYGGFLLGVRSVSGLAFYDWESNSLVRRIEITPKMVRSGNFVFFMFIFCNLVIVLCTENRPKVLTVVCVYLVQLLNVLSTVCTATIVLLICCFFLCCVCYMLLLHWLSQC